MGPWPIPALCLVHSLSDFIHQICKNQRSEYAPVIAQKRNAGAREAPFRATKAAKRLRSERGGTSRSDSEGRVRRLTFLSTLSGFSWRLGEPSLPLPFPIPISFLPVSGTPKGAELSHLFKRSDEEMCFSENLGSCNSVNLNISILI
jgi:hypothetical protein